MEKIYYNKLCRDKIPQIIHDKGFECAVRTLEEENEYKREIIRKVYEEANGITNHGTHQHLVEEMADLVLTLEAVKKEFGISEEELNNAVTQSIAEKGAYDAHLYLSWSSDTEYVKKGGGTGIDD